MWPMAGMIMHSITMEIVTPPRMSCERERGGGERWMQWASEKIQRDVTQSNHGPITMRLFRYNSTSHCYSTNITGIYTYQK